MSGVKVGTRLDHLIDLRTRVEQEIQTERRRLALDPTGVQNAPGNVAKPVTRTREDATTFLLRQLGVTPRAVKEWSVRAGINTAIPPGRVSLQLVQDYAERTP